MIPTRTADMLRRVLESAATDLHVALPGIVRSYDAATQTADVEPAVRRVIAAVDEDDEEDRVERLPILPSVPVAWPRAGGHFLHWPMEAGDSVLLVFSEQDMNAWRSSGEVADPGVGGRHGLSGAVAIPGLYPRANALEDASSSEGRVGREGGPWIGFPGSTIEVGGADALALSGNLAEHLSAIAAGLDAVSLAALSIVDPNYGVAAKALLDVSHPIATDVTRGS